MSQIVIEQNFLEKSSGWDKDKVKIAYEHLILHIEEYKYLAAPTCE